MISGGDFPHPVRAVSWFPVSHLTRDRELVWLLLGGGPRRGCMRMSRGRRTFWVPGPDGRSLDKLSPHAEPQLFRPLDVRTWPDPLPPAAILQPPRPPLPNPKDRVRLRDRLAPAGAPPLPETIAYAAPGAITLLECEARLLRALKTDRALPDDDRAKLRVRSNWPATAPEPGDVPPEITRRWQPFEQDVGDYLTAMAWFAALSGAEKRLVRRRAAGASFIRMAEEDGGRSDEWARQQYIAAITRTWTIANDGRPGPHAMAAA